MKRFYLNRPNQFTTKECRCTKELQCWCCRNSADPDCNQCKCITCQPGTLKKDCNCFPFSCRQCQLMRSPSYFSDPNKEEKINEVLKRREKFMKNIIKLSEERKRKECTACSHKEIPCNHPHTCQTPAKEESHQCLEFKKATDGLGENEKEFCIECEEVRNPNLLTLKEECNPSGTFHKIMLLAAEMNVIADMACDQPVEDHEKLMNKIIELNEQIEQIYSSNWH